MTFSMLVFSSKKNQWNQTGCTQHCVVKKKGKWFQRMVTKTKLIHWKHHILNKYFNNMICLLKP